MGVWNPDLPMKKQIRSKRIRCRKQGSGLAFKGAERGGGYQTGADLGPEKSLTEEIAFGGEGILEEESERAAERQGESKTGH